MSPVAVVTGAARGIGAATVDRLVAEGWSVVAVDVCADDVVIGYGMGTRQELDSLSSRHGVRVAPVVGDVRSQADMDSAVAVALDRFGVLDAVVAGAGVVGGGSPMWETDDDVWRALFEVNVVGVRRLVQAAVPALLDRETPRDGRVVAVASAAGMLGMRRLGGYVASKHAVIGMMRSLAADLAGTGVTANAVCPGSTRTATLEASAQIYGLDSVEELASHQLLERLLEPEEPAALIAWLCGPSSSGITGAALVADGGMTAF
ncbi:MAG: mycofactocin-coupled SDR family oxidoreductase [Actinomycetes bacterium]